MFTEEEYKALRFYEGDTEGEDPFLSDRKAYLTINSLLYPGIRNERARAAEGKKLNPAFFDDNERLLALYRNLVSAVCKGKKDTVRQAFRVERWSDFQEQRTYGTTLSFTSTSTAGFLPAYQDRIGIALLKTEIPPGFPALDFQEFLPHYAKSEEHEILLAPYQCVEYTEIPLLESERAILDAQGNLPMVSCRMKVVRTVPQGTQTVPLPHCEAGRRVYEALNCGRAPVEEDVLQYLRFKERLQQHIRAMLQENMAQDL